MLLTPPPMAGERRITLIMADQSKWGKWFEEKVFKPLEDKKMPVMEHLHEFQARLTRAVVIMACVFVGTFFYAYPLISQRFPLFFSRLLKPCGKT